MALNSQMKEQLQSALHLPAHPPLSEKIATRKAEVRSSFKRKIFPIAAPQSEPAPIELTPIEAPVQQEPAPSPEPPAVAVMPPASEPHPDLPKIELPAELEWLNQATPVSGILQGFVNRVRDAKTRISCTLGESREREINKKNILDRAQADLEYEQKFIAGLREQLNALNETLDECSMLAESSAAIASLLPASIHHKHQTSPPGQEQKRYTRPAANDPTILRRAFVREFFAKDPDTIWSAGEIIKVIPAIKQAHARGILPMMLSILKNDGYLERVEVGRYRLAKKK